VAEDKPAARIDPWILWFGGGAFLMCYFGQTILGVVQPTIDSQLGLSASEAQWIVNAFFLGMALFAAPGGRLGDYYGHRTVLLVALGVFALGSVSATVAHGFPWLVASIGVAGIGASTLYPSSAALVANSVPLEIRGKAIGQYSAIGVSVFVVAPLASGLLTELVSWRAVFGLQALMALGLAFVGWRFVTPPRVPTPEPFDARGWGILAVGLSAVLVALMQALVWGLDSASTLGLLAIGAVTLAAFVRFELRQEHPLLDLHLLERRTIVGIVIAMFSAQFLLNGFVIYLATFLQHILGMGPLLAALAFIPAMIVQPFTAIRIGKLTDRIGPRKPAIAGYALATACLTWVAIFVHAGSYWPLLPGLVLFGAAVAPMFTSLLTGLSNAVEADERGDANALVLTIRWIGAAVGTMALGLVIHSTEQHGIPTEDGYSDAFLLSAAVALVGVVACVALLRGPAERKRTHHHLRPHL